MFNDDLRDRVNKMEREIEGIKGLQTEVARLSLSITHLSDKMDNKFDALEKNLGDKIDGVDKRLSRIENGIITFAVVVLGGAFSILVFPVLKMMYL